MAVTVLIPTTLRGFAQQHSEVEVPAGTAAEVLAAVAEKYPDIREAVFADDGTLREFVHVFVGDRSIQELQGFATPVPDGAEVMLIPTIAGGSGVHAPLIPENREKLSNDEISRYSRHLLLKEVGVAGQRRLKAAKVLIVGLGGLGAPLAQYLAAAGVGTLGLVDFDEVELSNLQRQVIHRTRDIGRPKVASAKEAIRGINPQVKVNTYDYPLTADNALDILGEYDIIADATDNYPARYLINDVCVLLDKPDVFAAMFQFEGQVTVFYGKEGPCYRCVYPSPPQPGLVPSCSQGGVMGVLPGILGTIQAGEVIKLIVGGGRPLIGRMLVIDAWNMKFRELKLPHNPDCPISGTHPSIHELETYDYQDFCGLKKQEEEPVEAIAAKELKQRLDAGEHITLVDVREPHERAIIKFPKAKVIPIGQLARRQDELDPSRVTVFICKEGKRSILAIRTLREAGYHGPMFNLKDGINSWARDVDASMPQY